MFHAAKRSLCRRWQSIIYTDNPIFQPFRDSENAANIPCIEIGGEAKLGGPVNPATRIITLKPGDTFPITIKMDMEFEGKFIVTALDPITQTALGKALELETDYTV